MADARPWHAVYPPSVPREPVVPDISLPRMLDEAVARFAHARALAFHGTELTYTQLRTQVNHTATILSRLEVQPGDRVAFVLPNCPQLVSGLYAAMRLGAVAVLLNPFAGGDELHADLAQSGADVVVCVDSALATVSAARAGTAVRHVVVTRLVDALSRADRLRLVAPTRRARGRRKALRSGRTNMKRLAPATHRLSDLRKTAGISPPTVVVEPGSLAVIVFSGGATGPARPVELSHRALVAAAYQSAWWLPDARAGREVTLGLLPLFQIYGLTLALNSTLLLGSLLVLVPTFEPEQVVGALAERRVTFAPGTPTVLRALLGSERLRPGRTAALRSVLSVGARLPSASGSAFGQRSSSSVAESYGLTEAAGLTHAMPLAGPYRPGSVGVPLPLTEVRLIDPVAPRRPVAPGAVGELLVNGPQVSEALLAPDGFLHTGDLVAVDSEGFTTFVCRLADVVRVGGSLIYPAVVEGPLTALREVARAAAVQGYDAAGEPVLKVYVEAAPGMGLTVASIEAACSAHLPPDLMPAHVEVRPRLAVTSTGEVLRRLLRDPAPSAEAMLLQNPPPKKAVARKRAPTHNAEPPAPVKAAATPPVKRARRARLPEDSA